MRAATLFFPIATFLIGGVLGVSWAPNHAVESSDEALLRALKAQDAKLAELERSLRRSSAERSLIAPGRCQVAQNQLEAALAKALPEPAQEFVEEAPAEPLESVERQAALQRSDRLIERALATGIWGAEQRTELQAELTKLSPQQQRAAISKVIQAVNRDELEVRGALPPL